MIKEKSSESPENSEKDYILKNKELLTLQSVRKQLFKAFSLYGTRRFYERGSTVFKLNDYANEVYYIEKGRIRTYDLTPDGKEVTFEIYNPSESLGLTEVIAHTPRTRFAKTIGKKNILMIMKKEQLLDLLFYNKEFNLLIMWSLTHYVLRYQRLVGSLAILPVNERVIQLLIRMANEYGRESGDGILIDFPITHDDIAKMVGSSRSTITLILNKMRSQGIINWGKKKITILKWHELAQNKIPDFKPAK